MLNRLSSQELINKNLVQSGELDRASAVKKNPYADIDKNLLVDETDISNEAVSLYQRDLDVKKFVSLAMSDPDNLDCNVLVMNNVFSTPDSDFESKIIEGIFNSKTFLNDILG